MQMKDIELIKLDSCVAHKIFRYIEHRELFLRLRLVSKNINLNVLDYLQGITLTLKPEQYRKFTLSGLSIRFITLSITGHEPFLYEDKTFTEQDYEFLYKCKDAYEKHLGVNIFHEDNTFLRSHEEDYMNIMTEFWPIAAAARALRFNNITLFKFITDRLPHTSSWYVKNYLTRRDFKYSDNNADSILSTVFNFKYMRNLSDEEIIEIFKIVSVYYNSKNLFTLLSEKEIGISMPKILEYATTAERGEVLKYLISIGFYVLYGFYQYVVKSSLPFDEDLYRLIENKNGKWNLGSTNSLYLGQYFNDKDKIKWLTDHDYEHHIENVPFCAYYYDDYWDDQYYN